MKRFVLCIFASAIYGCVVIPQAPELPALVEVADPETDTAWVTIARRDERELYPNLTILLDDFPIARLEPAEYTKFQVSEGDHTISIQWNYGSLIYIGPGGAAELGSPGHFLRKHLRLRAIRDGEYYFTVRHADAQVSIPGDGRDDWVIREGDQPEDGRTWWIDEDLWRFKQADRLDGAFDLRNLKYRPVGRH